MRSGGGCSTSRGFPQPLLRAERVSVPQSAAAAGHRGSAPAPRATPSRYTCWPRETRLITRPPVAPRSPGEEHPTSQSTVLEHPSGTSRAAGRAGEPWQTGTPCAPSHARNRIGKPQAVHKAHSWKKLERLRRLVQRAAAPPGHPACASPASWGSAPGADSTPQQPCAPTAGQQPLPTGRGPASSAGGLCGCGGRMSFQNTNSCL